LTTDFDVCRCAGALLCAAFIFTRQVARLIADCTGARLPPLLRRLTSRGAAAAVPSDNGPSSSPSLPKSLAVECHDTEVARLSLT